MIWGYYIIMIQYYVIWLIINVSSERLSAVLVETWYKFSTELLDSSPVITCNNNNTIYLFYFIFKRPFKRLRIDLVGI